MIRGGIADLPLSRTLLAIHQKSREPSFWEVMDSCFSNICKIGSFKNPFITITSLSELYFQYIYSAGTNEKSNFHEVWQQRKLLKTIEMSEVLPDTYDEEYIRQFQPELTHKFH